MIDCYHPLPKNRLLLPQVTLCAVTSVNVAATIRALEVCLEQIDFACCKLLTDAHIDYVNPAIEVIPIGRISSAAAYSDYLLKQLVDAVGTSHCLIAQWDGHVIDARRWRGEFLEYDYIGASWPQFDDGYNVGNGGFSLRSKRLMEACRAPGFLPLHPEDIAIGQTNRTWLTERGMRFASRELADAFSAERAGAVQASFGYHGVWNMPCAIGTEGFWKIYRLLDERSTLWTDLWTLMTHVRGGRRPFSRGLRLLFDRLRDGAMTLARQSHV